MGEDGTIKIPLEIQKKLHKGKTITISLKEYKKLCEDSSFLDCLMAVGVDNWSGYGEAQDMFEEDK